MYRERLSVLKRAYKSLSKNNVAFNEASKNVAVYRNQSMFIQGLAQSLKLLESIIVEREREWRDAVLRELEAEIMQDLAYVYPSDGYQVKLSSRVLRGKIHIEAETHSYFAGSIAGDVSDSQGRLFQQVVSFAALLGVMKILGVNTVYVDEAFSGASKRNIVKINKLLRSIQERGFNIILIEQDTSMASGIEANVLYLSRSLDNKTTITGGGS